MRWLAPTPFFFSLVLHAGLLLTVLPAGQAPRVGSYEVDLVNTLAPALEKMKSLPVAVKHEILNQNKKSSFLGNESMTAANSDIPQETTTPAMSASNQSNARVEGDLDVYATALRREIDLRKTYPQMARARREQGRVEVRFTVLRDGQLQNIQLYKPNSSSDLNEAALNAVSGVKQFKPLPESFDKGEWDLTISIDFILDKK